ncbi:MAG TPA: hypothetical protein VIL96_05115 [Gaiellaceae bacterium]|jgi:O-antigen/teichoic acid export membrane protein
MTPSGTRQQKKETRAKRRTLFIVLMMLASILGLMKNVVFAKMLGPAELSYYGLMLIVVPFGVFISNLGLINALNAVLPMESGARKDSIDDRVGATFTAMLLLLALVSGIGLVLLSVAPIHDAATRISLTFSIAIIAASTVGEFYISLLRSAQQSVRVASLLLQRAIFVIGFGAAGAQLVGYQGVLAAELLSSIAVVWTAILLWFRQLSPRWPVDWRRVMSLLKIGTPLMLGQLVTMATFLLDRVFVATALPDELGQYTFATTSVLASVVVTGMLKQTLYPRLLFEFGAGAPIRAVRRRLWRALAPILVGGLMLIPVSVVAARLLSKTWFPEYQPALSVLPYLYAGSVLGLFGLYEVLLIVEGRARFAAVSSFGGAAIVLVGGFAIVAREPSLRAFALLFLAGQAVTALLLVLSAELAGRHRQACATRSHETNDD